MKQKKIYFSFLGSAFFQVLNFILPLIIVPFIIKKVGIERYGIIVLFQAVANYLGLLIDYSFNIVQVRNIIDSINNFQKTQKALIDALAFRFWLAFIACIIVFIIALINPFSGFTYKLYFAFLIWIIGQSIVFAWFLQAKNNLVAYSFLSFISKLLYAIQIGLFVAKPSDYENICMFWAITNLFLGIGIMVYIQKQYGFTFKFSNLNVFNIQKLKDNLIVGKDVFLSNTLNGISINTNVFILNLFVSHVIVGQYSIIEKLGLILKHFITVFHQVTFPNFCMQINNKQLLIRFMIKNHLLLILLTIISSICIVFFANRIISFFMGENLIVSNGLRLYILIPIFYSISVPFFQWLYSIHLDKMVRNAQLVAILTGIVLNLILSKEFLFLGTIIGSIIAELLLLLLLSIYALKNGFKFNK